MHRHDLIIETYRNWISKTDKVLDVGCGKGKMAIKIHKEFGCEIVGTDILDYSLNIVYYRMKKPNVLPFANNSFDIVMLNDVLHHSDYVKELIIESLRVAKKLLIFETNGSIIAKLGDFIISKIVHPKMNTPLNLKTYDEWQKLFKELKFKVITYKKNRPSLLMPVTTFGFGVEK